MSTAMMWLKDRNPSDSVAYGMKLPWMGKTLHIKKINRPNNDGNKNTWRQFKLLSNEKNGPYISCNLAETTEFESDAFKANEISSDSWR